MKIWIDDIRPIPEGFDIWFKTSYDAIEFLSQHNNLNLIDLISFDHDLGGEDTSRPVVQMIEGAAFSGEIDHVIRYNVHSANPVGAEWIRQAITSANNFIRKKILEDFNNNSVE